VAHCWAQFGTRWATLFAAIASFLVTPAALKKSDAIFDVGASLRSKATMQHNQLNVKLSYFPAGKDGVEDRLVIPTRDRRCFQTVVRRSSSISISSIIRRRSWKAINSGVLISNAGLTARRCTGDKNSLGAWRHIGRQTKYMDHIWRDAVLGSSGTRPNAAFRNAVR